MIAARHHTSSRRANASLSTAHLVKLRALIGAEGVTRARLMLHCSQHLFAELRSGGFATPATIARVESEIDAIGSARPVTP